MGGTTERGWTARDAVEGVQIFGGIGSGKTSGSGRTLALKYLKAGFGGLILTAKPDEKNTWLEYCKRAGREEDLIIVEAGGEHVFNFLDYEASRAEGGAFTENIVQVLKTVIRAGEEKASGKSDDAFWEAALDLLIFNTVDLCKVAYGSVSLQHIYDIVQKAPREESGVKKKKGKKERAETDQPDEPQPLNAFDNAFALATECANNLFTAWIGSLPKEEKEWLVKKAGSERQAAIDAIPVVRLMDMVGQFFFDSYLHLADKTRSIVDFSFSGFLYRLLREPAYSLFGRGQSTFTPEDSLEGKIILLNLPVKLYDKVGRDCQVMFKYIWQRAMERRDINANGRPVFLWADEAQHFLHEHDAEFQATARSSRVATVYLTQNMPNYYAAMGGARSEYRVKSFLGTLATKIFHANADIETNQYASALIGDIEMEDISRSSTTSGQMSATKNMSIILERALRPEEFVSLKTGGPVNNYVVESVIHHQGTPFETGFNHLIREFKQPNPSPLASPIS